MKSIFRRSPATASLVVLLWFAPALQPGIAMTAQQTPDNPLSLAEKALQLRKYREAVELASKAIEQAPTRPNGYILRAFAYAGLTQLREAIADVSKAIDLKPDTAVLMQRSRWYAELDDSAKSIADVDRALELDPKTPGAYRQRGREHFKLGDISSSIADFDRFVELEPEHENDLWERGLSRYYAGQFASAQKSFEDYHKVGPGDIENGLWRMLSQAEATDLATAQKDLLQYEPKRRPPFPDLYELYSGKMEPGAVIDHAPSGAANDADRMTRKFYAHLYVGLWYVVNRDKARATEHLQQAVAVRSTDYMWYVARVHLKKLTAEK